MEISPFLDRKLTRRFHTYDLGGNGEIDRADFETAARRLADEFGLATDHPAARRVFDLCVSLWNHLADAADTDHDGSITESEYKTAFAAGLLETEDSFHAGYQPFLEAITAVADQDGDGRLTVADHVRWTGALMALPEDDAKEIFRRLDADGDGYVDTNDLYRAIHDYYFDETPGSAGEWLLGPLDS